MGAEKRTSDKVSYPELSYALQGAFYEVYNVLGPGFREEMYRQALMQELRLRGIPFETEKYYDIPYKLGVADRYRADFVVDDKIIVELKAVDAMPPALKRTCYLTCAPQKCVLATSSTLEPRGFKWNGVSSKT